MGRGGGGGGGQVVSVLVFNNPSSNPAEAYIFSVKFVFEKNENKQKWGRVVKQAGKPTLGDFWFLVISDFWVPMILPEHSCLYLNLKTSISSQ